MTIMMLNGCAAVPNMQTVDDVDLDRFMGDWHVIASIPTIFDKHAVDPIETYSRNADGTIQTTYSFRTKTIGSDAATNPSSAKTALDIGPRKEQTAKGYIRNQQTNAVWGMQFFWPIRADYRIVYLDDDYQYTIIARNKKDFAWIMSRNTNISSQKRQELFAFVTSLGYQLDAFSIHH